ncbi:hypothetical protein [Microbacterium awajiense]
MSDLEQPEEKGLSRRTVTRAMAWSVPAIAIAAPVPAFAASVPPPPPVFDFNKGCATVGNGNGGCAGTDKTPQVPAYATNTSATDTLVLQITGAQSRVLNSGTFYSDFTVWSFNGTENNCPPQVLATGCGGFASFTVLPNQTVKFWVVGHEFGNSSSFEMNISYRWIEPCTPPASPVVVLGPQSTSFTLVNPSNNCNGSAVTLP